MITFKINKLPYEFPTSWPDVKYKHYLGLMHTSTINDQIALFMDVPRETLMNAEIKNLEQISLALSFLSLSPTFPYSNIVGPYIMPADVTIQSTGQFEDLRGLLMKMPKDPYEDPEKVADLYLHACAIYCQKIKDGKYNPHRVHEMKEELKDYSCAEVIGTGAFFLFRPLNLSHPTMNPFRRFIQRLRSMIVGLPSYQRTSVSLRRYFGLPAK